jgi:hypothetical protein
VRFPWSRRRPEEAGQERLRLRPVLRIVAHTYRANIRVLLPACLILFAPITLLDALAGEAELDVNELGTAKGIALLVGFLLNLLLAELGHELYVGLAGAAVMESRGGHRHRLRDLIRGLPYGRLILADLLFSLGTAFGLLLLIVPGVLFFGWFVLSGAVIKIENRRLFASFGRSRQLVRGNFWIVLLILGGIYFIEDVATTLAQSGAVWAFGHGVLADWLDALLVDLITAPLFAVAAVVLCLELIAIKGGAPNEEVARVAALSEPTPR